MSGSSSNKAFHYNERIIANKKSQVIQNILLKGLTPIFLDYDLVAIFKIVILQTGGVFIDVKKLWAQSGQPGLEKCWTTVQLIAFAAGIDRVQ